MKRLLKVVMVIATGAVLTTLLALEGGGVVQVRTVNAQTQQPRDTRIWFVGNGAQIVLEAGKPENPWALDVVQRNTLRLSGQGLDGDYRARIHGADSHLKIRQLMREKYGWRDAWVSMLFDTSMSRMVTLEPLANA